MHRLIVIPKHSSRYILYKKQFIGAGYFSLKRQFSDKYKSVEEFKKQRKEYQFGELILENIKNEPYNEVHSDSNEIHQRMSGNAHFLEQEKKSKSPDDLPIKKRKEEFSYENARSQDGENRVIMELLERTKALVIGFGAIIVAVVLHQLYMHYDFLKAKLSHLFIYDMGESKAKSMKDPSMNTRNIQNLKSKLKSELNDEALSNLKSLEQTPGLYVFGAFNDKKFPFRILFFDDMVMKDVKVSNDCLIAINEQGKIFKLLKGQDKPTLINLPFNVSTCEMSRDYIYFLTNGGKVVFVPRVLSDIDTSDLKTHRNWMLSKSDPYGEVSFLESTNSQLERGEKIKKISTGDCHVLMLSSKGRVFTANAAMNESNFVNKGQIGLPDFAPIFKNTFPPRNVAFDVHLLNYAVNQDEKGSQTLSRRKFISIAAGKFHSIALDNDSSVWSWGLNTSGQCGLEVNYKTDVQAFPKKVLTKDDFEKLCGHVVPKGHHQWMVEDVYAGNMSTYIKLFCRDETSLGDYGKHLFLSFGEGLKGQSGSSRYSQVCSEPQMIKAIMDLVEYNEREKATREIGIRDVQMGGNHGFIRLDNYGNTNDLLVFGDNEFGQLGNGKSARSSKPIYIPKLIEPDELMEHSDEELTKLAKRVNNFSNDRLQLADSIKLKSNREARQTIAAGDNSSAIYYKPYTIGH